MKGENICKPQASDNTISIQMLVPSLIYNKLKVAYFPFKEEEECHIVKSNRFCGRTL